MKSFAFLLLLGVAAASPIVDEVRKFNIYGASLPSASLNGHHDLSSGLRHDIHGTTYMYDHPIVMVMKQEGRDELAAFFIEKGLNSLVHDANTRFIHEHLRTGSEKLGVLVDSSKQLHLAEWDMPITKFLMPQGLTLAEYARIQSEVGAMPWVLVTSKKDVKAIDIERLVKISEFDVHDHFVKVAADFAADFAPAQYKVVEPSYLSLYRAAPLLQFEHGLPIYAFRQRLSSPIA